MQTKRNPWIAIMKAATLGRGLNLSADEVAWLSQDGAIETCAQNDVDRGTPGTGPLPTWDKIDPTKYPIKSSIVCG